MTSDFHVFMQLYSDTDVNGQSCMVLSLFPLLSPSVHLKHDVKKMKENMDLKPLPQV